MITPNQHLIKIRNALQSKGHELWFVGGCVRDSIRGEEPKDIDLCTDATPDEAMEIYREHNIRYFKTGLDHGTLTVRAGGESYEITTLRTESEHDGRRAVVAYTRDLNEDLSRRDLTINAMAMDFDGNVIDPFGGMSDLHNERVRLVGNSIERFKEDYLRILRFFRFHARFAGLHPLDTSAEAAILAAKDGLVDISGERIWQEMSKIIVGPHASNTLHMMQRNGVLRAIQLKRIEPFSVHHANYQCLSRPATILGLSVLKNSELEETMSRWKMSNALRREARFASKYRLAQNREVFKELLVDGAPLEWVEEILAFHDHASLVGWDVPKFPIDGVDLMKKGLAGPDVGNGLRALKESWKKSDYALSKSDLLQTL
jgi:hypothetical protein